MVRRFCARKRFIRNKRLALALQRYCRGYLARCKAQAIRRERATIVIQRSVRGWLCRLQYTRTMRSILLIQTYGRGMLARRTFAIQMANYKATVIQRYCRGYLARKAFAVRRRRLILAQSAIRRFLARRRLKKLKAEARTITHMQTKYKGLENKIISLQQKIDELTKSNQQLSKQAAEVPELQAKLESNKRTESELMPFKSLAAQLEMTVETLTRQLDDERDEKLAALDEKAREEAEFKQKFFEISVENEHLSREMAALKELTEQKINESHATQLFSETDDNHIHQAYQRMAQEKEQLENENSQLIQEIELFKRSQIKPYAAHSRTVSNVSSVNNDEDFGYASAKNTLEFKRDRDALPNGLSDSNAGTPITEHDKEKLKNLNNAKRSSPESYEEFSECFSFCVIALKVT